MGAPNVLAKVVDKLPELVAKSNVAAVAKQYKVSTASIYYHLGKGKKKVGKKTGKTK